MELLVKDGNGTQRVVPLSRRITTLGSDAGSDVPVADPALPPIALHLLQDGAGHTATCHEGATLTVNGKRLARL